MQYHTSCAISFYYNDQKIIMLNAKQTQNTKIIIITLYKRMAVSNSTRDIKKPPSNMTIIAIVIVVMFTIFALLYFTPLLQYILAIIIFKLVGVENR